MSARVAERVRALTLDESAAALGLGAAPRWLRRAVTLPLAPVARRLGRELGQFDGELGQGSLQDAAARTLLRMGATLVGTSLPVPATGPLLLVSNHPGAYDALSLLAVLPRDDLAIVVAERAFLRALPALASKCIFVPDLHGASRDVRGRSAGLKRALAHLRRGGAVLHFGAGRIEPDPAFHPGPSSILDWQPGAGALALATQRASGNVHVFLVSGVHSERAKRSLLVRTAESRGVTTLAVLLQLAHPYYRDARVRVQCSPPLAPLPADRIEATRALERAARALLPAS
jgi:hypothetical protein